VIVTSVAFTKDMELNKVIDSVYFLHERIGSGSVATVFRAELRKPGRITKVGSEVPSLVAIKRIRRSAVTPRAFLNECDIMIKLDHPNIVRYYEYFESPEYYFVVMELLTGGELFDAIATRQHFSEIEASAIIKQLASALVYLEENHIVHRDMKPENVMYNDTNVKIIDFGISRDISKYDSLEPLTDAVGTLGYVSPELLRGDPYGTKVDMWALGVLLYTLLSGTLPFHHTVEKVQFEMIKSGVYELETDDWKQVTQQAKSLIRGLLQVNPEKRFSPSQVLDHPWVNNITELENADRNYQDVIDRFKDRKNSKFKSAVMKLRTLAVFDKELLRRLSSSNEDGGLSTPRSKSLLAPISPKGAERYSMSKVLGRIAILIRLFLLTLFSSISAFFNTGRPHGSPDDLTQFVQRRVSMPLPTGRMLNTDVARMYASKSHGTLHDTKKIVFLIPGTPGLVDCYLTMLASIYEYYDASVSVLCIGHAGNSKWSLPKDNQSISLEEQIQHKIAVFRREVTSLKDTGDDDDVFEIFVIGYGVGIRIGLEMQQRLPEYRFIKFYGVSPSVPFSYFPGNNGWFENRFTVNSKFNSTIAWYTTLWLGIFSFFIPKTLKHRLLKMILLRKYPHVEDEFVSVMFELLHPDIIKNALSLNDDHLKSQRGLDKMEKMIVALKDRITFIVPPVQDDVREWSAMERLKNIYPRACYATLPHPIPQSFCICYDSIDFILETVLSSIDETEFEF